MSNHLFCNSPCATFIRELPAPSIPVLSLLERRIILHKMTVFIENRMLIQPFFCSLTDRTLGYSRNSIRTASFLFITPFLHGFMHPEAGRWTSLPCGIFCVKATLPSQLIHLGIWNVCASPRPIFAVKKYFSLYNFRN